MSRSGDQSSSSSSILTSHDPILKRALFAEMLQDLTFNSKDVINKITLFAGKNKDVADIVHELLTGKLREAPKELLLSNMYVIDSIVKNIGEPYKHMFQNSLVPDFLSVFDRSTDKMKMSLHKLRHTWDQYYSLIKLHELDSDINTRRDTNWAIKLLPKHLAPKKEVFVNPNFKKEGGAKVKNEPGKKHVITGLTRVAHGQVKIESKSSMVLDKLKKQKEEQEANKKLEQAQDEIRKLKEELEKSKKMSLKEKAKGIAREQQEREEKAKQDKSDRKALEKETAEQKQQRKLDRKDRKRKEKEEAERLERLAEEEKVNREKVNMAKNKMLGDDRSKKIHNTMGEIRYGDKKKEKETPKNLVSPDLEKMFREELLPLIQKPISSQNMLKIHPMNKPTFIIPGHVPVPETPKMPDQLKNFNKDDLYQYARSQMKEGKITKEQFKELCEMLQALFAQREKQLRKQAASEKEKIQRRAKRRGFVLADEVNGTDEEFYMRIKDEEKRAKLDVNTDPLNMNGGDILSSSDEEHEFAKPSKEQKPNAILEKQLAAQRAMLSRMKKPVEQLPLIRQGPPGAGPRFSTGIKNLPQAPNGVHISSGLKNFQPNDIMNTLNKLKAIGVINGDVGGLGQNGQSGLPSLPIMDLSINGGKGGQNLQKMDSVGKMLQDTLQSANRDEDQLVRMLTDMQMKDYSRADTEDLTSPVVKRSGADMGLRKVISYLQSGMLCPVYGLRFPPDHQRRYHNHLDWRASQAREESNNPVRNRSWYKPQINWVTYHEMQRAEKPKPKQAPKIDLTDDKVDLTDNKKGGSNDDDDDDIILVNSTPGKKTKSKPSMIHMENTGNNDDNEKSLFVPDTPTPSRIFRQFSKKELRRLSSTASNTADNNEVPLSVLNQLESQYCAISNEPFETYYNEKEEEWYAKDCVILEGKAYHLKNLKDKSLLLTNEDEEEENEMENGNENNDNTGDGDKQGNSGNTTNSEDNSNNKENISDNPEQPMKSAKLDDGTQLVTKSGEETDMKRKIPNLGITEPVEEAIMPLNIPIDEVPIDIPIDEDSD